MSGAEQALQTLLDPHVEAVDAWKRTLYPEKADPLAVARALTERKTAVKALREAAAAERELAMTDRAAKRKADAEALEAERASVSQWSERLFGKAPK